MAFSTRRVEEKDAASIVALLSPIIRAGGYTIMDKEVSLAEQLDFIRGFPERGVFHVAICDGCQEVMGLQDVSPLSNTVTALEHVGEISTFVALGSHRMGIGRRLSRATFRAARDQAFKKLCATVRADNPGAVAFYRNQGFRVIGTAHKHAFVGGRYVDEILMEKLLEGT